jgi:hypothetical protein
LRPVEKKEARGEEHLHAMLTCTTCHGIIKTNLVKAVMINTVAL